MGGIDPSTNASEDVLQVATWWHGGVEMKEAIGDALDAPQFAMQRVAAATYGAIGERVMNGVAEEVRARLSGRLPGSLPIK